MRSARSLVEEAKAFQPDLVLILKGESLRASTLEQLKAKTRATLAVWWVDHPFMNVETRRPWTEIPASVPQGRKQSIFCPVQPTRICTSHLL